MMDKIQQFHNALLSAFTIQEMTELLRYEMSPSEHLESIAKSDGNKENQFFDVIEWAIKRGRLNELALAAYRKRSANEKIRIFFQDYGSIDFLPDRALRAPSAVMNNTTPYVIEDTPSQSIRDRVRELELLWRGFDGNNGLRSEIKALKADVAELKKTVDQLVKKIDNMERTTPSSSNYVRLLLALLAAFVVLAALLNIAASVGWI